MRKHSLSPEILGQVGQMARGVIEEVGRAYIGPEDVGELLLTALVGRGHVLLEGVPGVAKTTLAKAFSATIGCRYRRIQFTPDLLPADITGTYVLNPREGSFALREGPIFANVVLGDEINRAPAKTQSALLEAMQENQVTIEGETRPLDAPFMVIATQNPIEQEGTYPLPEAQIDRFLMKLNIGYPSTRDERRILQSYAGPSPEGRAILSPDDILRMQDFARYIHIEDELCDYIIALSSFTRSHGRVLLGASPRASLSLMYAARGRALLHGRDFVLPDDVKRLAPIVLGHRLVLTPDAELDGTTRGQIIREALEKVSYRRDVSAT
ncbi:MAG: MoxR family ATPase [Deltaproteobacteria bacterium]|nr:MoxR family ATPase [Deltaproteobacteria bacterium]